MSDLGKIANAAFCDEVGGVAYDDLPDKFQRGWTAAAHAVAREVAYEPDSVDAPSGWREEPQPDGGQWMRIAFMGHVTLTGYVTVSEVGGHAVYHVDLPEKLWDGNPLAWREYAASALYSREPVTEQAVRLAWEARERSRKAWEARALEPAETEADACESVLYDDDEEH